jgi:hypothetical protein
MDPPWMTSGTAAASVTWHAPVSAVTFGPAHAVSSPTSANTNPSLTRTFAPDPVSSARV